MLPLKTKVEFVIDAPVVAPEIVLVEALFELCELTSEDSVGL